MTQRTRDVCLILAVAGLVFFVNLGGPRLWDRDEPRNAGCAAEMLAAQDWVTPMFNAEIRTHKPVLLYWFMMTAYAVMGVNEFSARFWSAALGTGSLLIVYDIGRRLFSRSAGLWSAIVLGTTVMFGVASRAATPDAVLIFFTTLALGLYVRFTFTERSEPSSDLGPYRMNSAMYPQKWWQAALMFVAMGMAVLAKGPVGLVLPTAVIGMFLLIKRLPTSLDKPSETRTWTSFFVLLVRPFAPLHFLKTCWHMRPITALAVALAVALPWYLWVHWRTQGAWTHGFFVVHNLERATTAMEGHDGGLLFYPLALIVGFFPWSIFWLPALLDAGQGARQRHRWQDGYLLAFCWAGVYLALFSIARTKLPSYITPCYPGVALLSGAFIDRWTRGELLLRPLWPRLAFGSLLLVGLLTAIAVPLAAQQLLPGEEFLGGIGLVLMLGGLLAWSQAELGKPMNALRLMTAAVLVTMVSIFGFASVRVDQHRGLERLSEAVGVDEAGVRIVCYAKLEPSWVFYWKRPLPETFNPAMVASLLQKSSREDGKTSIITTVSQLPNLEKHLEGLPIEMQQIPYFLDDEDLVVLKARPLHALQTAGGTSESSSR